MEVKIKPRLLLVVTVTLFVVFLASVLLHNKNLDTSQLWTYALLDKGSSVFVIPVLARFPKTCASGSCDLFLR
jgi:hypothetical protein